MSITLYELSQNYKNLMDLLYNEEVPTEMVEAALNEVDDQIEEKAENIAKVIKSLEGDISAISGEIERLTASKKTLNNRIDGLKKYLEDSMKSTGKTKFKGQLFSFNIQKNPKSVDILDEAAIPSEYLVPQPAKVDKKKILEILKNGEEVAGAVLKQTESLRIR